MRGEFFAIAMLSCCRMASERDGKTNASLKYPLAPQGALASHETQQLEKTQAQEADAWLASYRAGQEVLPSRTDPGVMFVAPQADATCDALPAQRPDSLRISLTKRGNQPENTRRWAYTTPQCYYEWLMLHLEPPRVTCVEVTPALLDEIYVVLRSAQLHTLETRALGTPSPHRGGPGFSVSWPDHRCEASDSVFTRLEPSSQARFDDVVDKLTAVANARAVQ